MQTIYFIARDRTVMKQLLKGKQISLKGAFSS